MTFLSWFNQLWLFLRLKRIPDECQFTGERCNNKSRPPRSHRCEYICTIKDSLQWEWELPLDWSHLKYLINSNGINHVFTWDLSTVMSGWTPYFHIRSKLHVHELILSPLFKTRTMGHSMMNPTTHTTCSPPQWINRSSKIHSSEG